MSGLWISLTILRRIELPDEYKKILSSMDEEAFISSYTQIDNRMKTLIEFNEEEIEKLRGEVAEYIAIQNSDEFREQFEFINSVKNNLYSSLKDSRYYDVFV